ncbi:hypothetical protein CSC32_2188 [Pseudomonas aeruginosa]|nr:hypothetical protein CSC32_2188 [Pseudomonas aeruginosa]
MERIHWKPRRTCDAAENRASEIAESMHLNVAACIKGCL